MLMDALLSHVSLHIDSALCAVISSIWIPVAPYFLPVTLPRMLVNANTTLFHVDTPIPLFTGIAAVMLCSVVRCEHSPHVNCDLEEQHELNSHNTLLTTCPIGLYQALLYTLLARKLLLARKTAAWWVSLDRVGSHITHHTPRSPRADNTRIPSGLSR